MKKVVAVFSLLIGLSSLSFAASPEVRLETTLGNIVIQLDSSAAPVTVDNFLKYVNSKFYDGTIFHRVIKNFMIQGGGFTPDMNQKQTNPPITNEADNGLKNTRGTIAMARTQDPNSATSQFFINTVDNNALDFKARTFDGWGYCVFGKVISGMDVVDSISNVQTTSMGMYQDVPSKPVIITKAVVIKNKTAK